MRKQIYVLTVIGLLLTGGVCSSCDDFLSILPKGEKIPTTGADFEAFIRNADNHKLDATQALNLINDTYIKTNRLSALTLDNINYNWLEDEDRIRQNNSDEMAYYYSYQAIAYWNLIIQEVPGVTEYTESQKNELMAQAKVLRAMNYFFLTNYYAEPYDSKTAATKLSVPQILSMDMGSPSVQLSIGNMYEFILSDLLEALPYLPEEGATVLHPALGTAYAMLARVYLTMENYTDALVYAEKALEQNDYLYDWRVYYEENREQIEKPDDWSTSCPAVGLDNPENYIFRYGTNAQKNSGRGSLPLLRGKAFEKGDARFASQWKKRYQSPDTLWYSIRNDKFNGGGITTPEMYYIKAECLARKGGKENIDAAMDALNRVRIMRFFKDDYKPLQASTTQQAVEYIIREKANEYVLTPIPFWDMRRLNKDPQYQRTLTKEYNGRILSLLPASHLWTMPFPMGAVENAGNGTLQQNVER